jgi:ABC-2 type transport system permease protein
MKKDNKHFNKKNSLITAIAGLLGIIIINLLGSLYFQRFDLTVEKRHTLTQQTIEILEDLEDVVFVRVYLEGEFPGDFRRLRNSFQEKLDEMRAYARGNIQYEFINPAENKTGEELNSTYQKLVEAGLEPTDLTIRNSDGVEQKIIFPGAILAYAGKELPLQLLKSKNVIPSPEMLNNSINNLEYSLTSTIKRLIEDHKGNVAILTGHGELEGVNIYDFQKTIAEQYNVETIALEEKLDALLLADLLVVPKPITPFSEKEKFIIDQFIMRGGKVIWLIDALDASMDSLRVNGGMEAFALRNDINLGDLFFHYGVRIQDNLVLDRSAGPIPITVGQYGDQPNIQLFPWFYYPTLIPSSSHPIVNNIDPIHSEFISTIDTVEALGIKKTIVLTTSPYTRIDRAPVRVNMNVIEQEPDFVTRTAGPRPVAVLLEGEFTSLFANRLAPNLARNKRFVFLDKALKSSKQLVIADGDIIKNATFKGSNGEQKFYPLSYDKYLRQNVYGNGDLLLNAVNFLLDDVSLIEIRSREVKVRKLDPEKTRTLRSNIQTANLTLPIIFAGLLGFVLFVLRKKKFSK